MKHQNIKSLMLSLLAMSFTAWLPLAAQTEKMDSPNRNYAPAAVKKAPQRVIYTDADLPDGYSRLGATNLWVMNDSATFDVLGKFNKSYYSSTFNGDGYNSAIHVDDQPYAITLGDIRWYSNAM